MSRVIAEYKMPGRDSWLLVLGIEGETYDDLAAFMRREFKDLVDIRPRQAEQPEAVGSNG